MIVTLVTRSAKIFTLVVSTTVTAIAALSWVLPPHVPGFPVAVEVLQDEDLSRLIAALQSAEAEDRAMAACRIGRLRNRDVGAARDGLLALLGDDAAVEGKLCRDYENRRRGGETGSTPGREAAIALEDVGASAIEPLVGVLQSGSGAARQNAALALGLIEDEQAIDAMAAALSDELDAVRARAAWSLGMIEDSSAVEALSEALEDDDAGVRKHALWALMRCVDADDAELDYAALAATLRKALGRGGEAG